MTVKELITELQKLDGNRIVMIEEDFVHDEYSELTRVETDNWVPVSNFSDRRHSDSIRDGLREIGWDEEEIDSNIDPAVFFMLGEKS